MASSNKKSEKEISEKKPQKGLTKPDKELYWVLGVMLVLIVVFIISFSFFRESNSFEYNGLKFTKTLFGDLPLYRYTYLTSVTVRTITGEVIRTTDSKNVILLIRVDPRKNKVPVTGKIEYFAKEKSVYVSINSTGLLCPYSQVALAELGSFLSQNDLIIETGSADETDAKENNLTYISCDNYPDNMVILLQSGEESSVARENNCYIITVADCDVIPPVEKFIVQSIIDSKD